MSEENPIMRELMQKVADKLTADLRDTLTAAVEREISRTLSGALLEGEFYRRVNEDLQKGFKEIYQEIKVAKSGNSAPVPVSEDPNELFSRASNQLDAILQTTENATVKIIETIENLQTMSDTLGGIVKSFERGGVSKSERETLGRINDALSRDLMSIMTTLSFQDLTGQRIKIIIETIKKIEKIVLDVYMTTGLMIKARAEAPAEEADFNDLQAKAKTQLSTLQGPQLDSTQGSVDDLLASLGL
ncbi:chemotaxis protein CheZ [Humidesulfovibrio mexicanus]|uniref:Chemotaxis protein CheZ n=1 Tax=Humidesulfovibrio mexicanus TaxID=147047 RepID=A0A238XVY1_9BACT|nr:protein phosphatase CheZ [Humidesulfovibrio mexicanus]SNR62718.1 chemotaxis protein CheZ [Humidesulfovibrio mexicanus]